MPKFSKKPEKNPKKTLKKSRKTYTIALVPKKLGKNTFSFENKLSCFFAIIFRNVGNRVGFGQWAIA